MANTVGHRETEMALQLGKLYSADEALAVKLVDELAEPQDVLARAQEQMAKWVKIPRKKLNIIIHKFQSKITLVFIKNMLVNCPSHQ